MLRPVALSVILVACGGVIENAKPPAMESRDASKVSVEEQHRSVPPAPPAAEPRPIGARAQFERGLAYQKGEGVKKDDRAAAAWFLQAAEQGHLEARLALAAAYEFGTGVERDPARAFAWLLKAAEQGNAEAQAKVGIRLVMGSGTASNVADGLTWLRKAAEQGNVGAQLSLARLLEQGDAHPGRGPDDAELGEAVRWYRSAADAGNTDASLRLAGLYYEGRGVAKDLGEAALHYRPAAERGDVEAQYRLALLMERGEGVPSNPTQAAALYEKAAKQGHAGAMNNLGWMYFEGQGVTRDEKQGVQWFRAAADKGEKLGFGSLAYAYEYGSGGLAADSKQALAYYDKDGGNWAKKRRERLSMRVACESGADTRLFDTKLKCADRSLLRYRAVAGGARVKHARLSDWGDTYETSSVLSGSRELYIAYTFDDWFAIAEYEFPGGKQMILEVGDMVASKYGKPRRIEGILDVGPMSATWTLKDGIVVEVRRGWPDTTTYLSYTHPVNYAKMKAEKAKMQRDKDAARYRAQGTAF